jgi:hypothetical protein
MAMSPETPPFLTIPAAAIADSCESGCFEDIDEYCDVITTP